MRVQQNITLATGMLATGLSSDCDKIALPVVEAKITYDRNELLQALSLALDFADSQPLDHATRTAYIGLRLARTLGLSEEEVENVYIASFLHDIGAGNYCDLAQGQVGCSRQADLGSQLMDMLPFSPGAREFVRWHHAYWNVSGENCAGSAPLGSQVVQLAEQLELRYDTTNFYFRQRARLWEWAQAQRGHCFVPEVIDAFLATSEAEKFWLDLTNPGLAWVLGEIQPVLTARLTPRELEQIANVFALIIDSKSSYTYRHSRGVGELMARLAPKLFSNEQEIFQMRIAALLHDLGKLAVPTEILDKNAKLTAEEFERIKAHPYYTKFILGRVKGFESIKEWAGNHHETVDGWGYPEKKKDLSIPERLMAVADVYQALTEERPYRRAMDPTEALAVMASMVKQQKLCPTGVALLREVV